MPIYDLSYQRIRGIRKPQRFRFPPIAWAGMAQFFKRKANLALFFSALGIPLLIGLTLRTLLFWASDEMRDGLPSFISDLLHLGPAVSYLFVTTLCRVFTVLLVLLSASAAIASDLRSNALEIYFSRPISRLDYVLGKACATLGLVAAAIAAPLTLLFVVDVALTEEPGFLMRQLPLLFELNLAVFMSALPLTLIALALSSIGRSTRNVTVLFISVLLGGKAIGGVLFDITRNPAFALFDIGIVVDRLIYDMFDVAKDIAVLRQNVPGLDKLRAPMESVEIGWCVLAYLAWIVAPMLLLRARVRGFEVVKTS